MGDSFNLGFFIVVGMLFFGLPFLIAMGIINFFISNHMAKRGLQKSKYYWFKLVGFSVLVIILGLFIYDGYYKLAG